MIAIPPGPEGGAGLLGDGIADAATIADRKARHMGTDRLTALFDTAPPSARRVPAAPGPPAWSYEASSAFTRRPGNPLDRAKRDSSRCSAYNRPL
jgi:hypothetical protein